MLAASAAGATVVVLGWAEPAQESHTNAPCNQNAKSSLGREETFQFKVDKTQVG